MDGTGIHHSTINAVPIPNDNINTTLHLQKCGVYGTFLLCTYTGILVQSHMEIEDRAGFPYGAQQHMNGIFFKHENQYHSI